MGKFGTKKTFILFVFLALTLVFGLAGSCKAQTGIKPTEIKLIEKDYSSFLINTEIVAQIIEKQFGYSNQRIQMSTSASWAALDRGDVDLGVEVWLPGRQPEIQPYLDKGTIAIGSEIFPGLTGWWVPRYVVEGDSGRGITSLAPDLKSILDLQTIEKGGKGYWKLFENPENPGLGELVGGPPGWYDNVYDRSRIMGYDLPLWRSTQSEAVMLARMVAADKRGQPLLINVSSPNWIFSQIDLLMLEEPNPWYQGAFQDETKGYACAYPPQSIRTVVSSKLKEKAPEVYNLMMNIDLGLKDINALMFRVDVKGEPVSEAAADWITSNQDRIRQWIGIK